MRPTAELRTQADIILAKLILTHRDSLVSPDILLEEHITGLYLDETTFVTGMLLHELLTIVDNMADLIPGHRDRINEAMRLILTKLEPEQTDSLGTR